MRKQSLRQPFIKRARKLLCIWHSSMKRKAKMRRQPIYKEYIDENQDNPTALICLGGMELEKGNYDSAINYLKMALDLDAGSQKQEAQRNLILAYEQSGDFTSAKSEMEDYTKNYPNDEEAAREYLFLMTR